MQSFAEELLKLPLSFSNGPLWLYASVASSKGDSSLLTSLLQGTINPGSDASKLAIRSYYAAPWMLDYTLYGSLLQSGISQFRAMLTASGIFNWPLNYTTYTALRAAQIVPNVITAMFCCFNTSTSKADRLAIFKDVLPLLTSSHMKQLSTLFVQEIFFGINDLFQFSEALLTVESVRKDDVVQESIVKNAIQRGAAAITLLRQLSMNADSSEKQVLLEKLVAYPDLASEIPRIAELMRQVLLYASESDRLAILEAALENSEVSENQKQQLLEAYKESEAAVLAYVDSADEEEEEDNSELEAGSTYTKKQHVIYSDRLVNALLKTNPKSTNSKWNQRDFWRMVRLLSPAQQAKITKRAQQLSSILKVR